MCEPSESTNPSEINKKGSYLVGKETLNTKMKDKETDRSQEEELLACHTRYTSDQEECI